MPERDGGYPVRPLSAFLLEHYGALRLAVFLGLLCVMALAESVAPRRARALPRGAHAAHNLALLAVGAALTRVLVPAGALGFAVVAETRGLGVLRLVDWPAPLAFARGLVAFLALDLAIWAQHVAAHRVPLFWRVHRVHHADLDLDATSGVRFHPVELLASLAWKGVVIIALGASPATVALFEVVLNGMAVFNHANVRLPQPLERALRVLLVTPDVHRVHHSTRREETDSNYGFNLVLWDRVFRTYRAEPRDGHTAMQLGLADERDPRLVARWVGMLKLPFESERRADD